MIRLGLVCLALGILAQPHQAPNLNNTEVKRQPVVSKQTKVAKVEPQKAVEPKPQAEVQQERPVEVATQTQAESQTSCVSEIQKYDWHQGIATAVATAESGLRPDALNDNPNTGDYSVGCFQINIYGANARTRPSEAALKDPATNVAWAWKLYTGNGHSFIGQWGVCRGKVSCY